MTIPAIILAAGASRRLGQPKQLLRLDPASPETLLERAVRLAREANLSPVIVVLGANHDQILATTSLPGANPILNPDWHEGMASSIQLGLHTTRELAPNAPGLLLMTCDQPAVTADHLRRLTATDILAASEYAGRRGVPAYIPLSHWSSLASLRGDTGARDLLLDAKSLSLPLGALDIDTPEDLAYARTLAL
jgi:CTP:molybdopterin cytidylyltransferase MocA